MLRADRRTGVLGAATVEADDAVVLLCILLLFLPAGLQLEKARGRRPGVVLAFDRQKALACSAVTVTEPMTLHILNAFSAAS